MRMTSGVKRIRGDAGNTPVIIFAVLLLLMTSLTACGKRPANVDLPDGVEIDNGQQIYPDPKTDPKP